MKTLWTPMALQAYNKYNAKYDTSIPKVSWDDNADDGIDRSEWIYHCPLYNYLITYFPFPFSPVHLLENILDPNWWGYTKNKNENGRMNQSPIR